LELRGRVQPVTKRKVRPPAWSMVALLTLTAQRPDGPVLAVMVSPSDYVVIAFEVREPPKRGATDVEAATAVFGAHAHKVVGQAVSMAAAVALANHYVAAWLESDAAAAELCKCVEIGATS
jgi:hypothetical protein